MRSCRQRSCLSRYQGTLSPTWAPFQGKLTSSTSASHGKGHRYHRRKPKPNATHSFCDRENSNLGLASGGALSSSSQWPCSQATQTALLEGSRPILPRSNCNKVANGLSHPLATRPQTSHSTSLGQGGFIYEIKGGARRDGSRAGSGWPSKQSAPASESSLSLCSELLIDPAVQAVQLPPDRGLPREVQGNPASPSIPLSLTDHVSHLWDQWRHSSKEDRQYYGRVRVHERTAAGSGRVGQVHPSLL